MQRTNPFLSLPGLLIAFFFLGGLVLSLIFTGGRAFSPGSLTARASKSQPLLGFESHADFESQCSRCHQPLKTNQGELCLDCHQEISDQLVNDEGLHSRMNQIIRCFACHPDHEGKTFSPNEAALLSFDHSVTHFSLVHHALDYSASPMRCETCHAGGNRDPVVMTAGCLDCHSGSDASFMAQHVLDFGSVCLDCHDGKDRMVAFDHSTTRFSLDGQHTEIDCAACHQNGLFVGTPLRCQDCHNEPDIHRSVFNSACEDCHMPQAWSPVQWNGSLFDHQQTNFSLARHRLNQDGAPLTCTACHATTALPIQVAVDLPNFSLVTCQECHQELASAFYTNHTMQYGDACLACHDGVDRMNGFDHQQVFPLEGQHAEIACLDCHQTTPSEVTYHGLSRDCISCHAEPEIHAGFFGVVCQDCHTSIGWRPALLQKHDFPIEHGGVISDCQKCHPTNYVEYSCYECHEHQSESIALKHLEEGIVEPELSACVTCHAQGLTEDR
jgi:hypothetical protein